MSDSAKALPEGLYHETSLVVTPQHVSRAAECTRVEPGQRYPLVKSASVTPAMDSMGAAGVGPDSPEGQRSGGGALGSGDAASRTPEYARGPLWHSLSCVCEDCLHGDVLWTDHRHEILPGYRVFADDTIQA
jgi:hypothetical protein